MPSTYAFLILWLAFPISWAAVILIGYLLGVRRG